MVPEWVGFAQQGRQDRRGRSPYASAPVSCCLLGRWPGALPEVLSHAPCTLILEEDGGTCVWQSEDAASSGPPAFPPGALSPSSSPPLASPHVGRPCCSEQGGVRLRAAQPCNTLAPRAHVIALLRAQHRAEGEKWSTGLVMPVQESKSMNRYHVPK